MTHKTIPKFKSEPEEQEFWSKNDSTEYINWQNGRVGVFPKLKPSTETISLRLPKSFLNALRIAANKRDIPYQSLMKMFLVERMQQELSGTENNQLLRESQKRGRRT